MASPPGRIQELFKVKSPPLGRGPFGEIREAFDVKLKQRRLLKVVFKLQYNETELEKINNECIMLEALDHPGILKIFQ